MTKQEEKDFTFISSLLEEYRDSFSVSTMFLKGEKEDAKDAIKLAKIRGRFNYGIKKRKSKL